MLLKNNVYRVFKIFFEHPEKEFHLREIARVTRLSTTAVSSALRELYRKNIIVKKEIGIYGMFKADMKNENFKEMKKAFEILEKL